MANYFGVPTPGKYQLIYLDPPWQYADTRSEASTGAALSAYSCMSPREMADMLPVIDSIALPQCSIAMWATFPKLPEALELLKAWNFRYCTALFVWVKRYADGTAYAGLGHYTRANAEMVLLGRRGDALPRHDLTVRQIVESERGRHSAKPAEVRQRLERLFGPVSRIELFARERVEGWANDIDR